MLKEASFYEKIEDKTVRCNLCSHRCRIADGRRGICAVRENRGGTLYSLVYGMVVAKNIDPIEKKPLFHFLPDSLSYSIATVGCNFRCKHCQNYDISQYPIYNKDIIGEFTPPEKILERALSLVAKSISYTYVEPTIFFEYAFDIAVVAREHGLKNIFVTNGYITPEALKKIAPVLDSANIDLKAFTDDFYKSVCGARLAPVLESIKLHVELGIWTELTTLLIPGKNDSEGEINEMAKFIKNISVEIPWHLSAFHPTYKMTDVPRTPNSTILKAVKIAKDVGLKYVYGGNIHAPGLEDTFCPSCGKVVIRRDGFTVLQNDLLKGDW